MLFYFVLYIEIICNYLVSTIKGAKDEFGTQSIVLPRISYLIKNLL